MPNNKTTRWRPYAPGKREEWSRDALPTALRRYQGTLAVFAKMQADCQQFEAVLAAPVAGAGADTDTEPDTAAMRRVQYRSARLQDFLQSRMHLTDAQHAELADKAGQFEQRALDNLQRWFKGLPVASQAAVFQRACRAIAGRRRVEVRNKNNVHALDRACAVERVARQLRFFLDGPGDAQEIEAALKDRVAGVLSALAEDLTLPHANWFERDRLRALSTQLSQWVPSAVPSTVPPAPAGAVGPVWEDLSRPVAEAGHLFDVDEPLLEMCSQRGDSPVPDTAPSPPGSPGFLAVLADWADEQMAPRPAVAASQAEQRGHGAFDWKDVLNLPPQAGRAGPRLP